MTPPFITRLLASGATLFAISVAPLTAGPGEDEDERPEVAPKPPKKKVAWLGVSARAIEPVESTQLGLPPGFGLVVDFVFSGSPAADAGIAPHDILRKLDDQLLVNPAQLKTLVCSKNKGDLVKLTLLRSGEELELEATLAEHEVPAVAFRMLRPHDGGEPFPVPADPSAEDLPVASLKDLLEGKGLGIRGVHAKSLDFDNSAASLSDATGTYTLTENGKSAVLRATKEGKEFFKGPVSTEQDRAKLPAEIRKKLLLLEAVTGRAKALDEDPVRSRGVRRPPVPARPSFAAPGE